MTLMIDSKTGQPFPLPDVRTRRWASQGPWWSALESPETLRTTGWLWRLGHPDSERHPVNSSPRHERWSETPQQLHDRLPVCPYLVRGVTSHPEGWLSSPHSVVMCLSHAQMCCSHIPTCRGFRGSLGQACLWVWWTQPLLFLRLVCALQGCLPPGQPDIPHQLALLSHRVRMYGWRQPGCSLGTQPRPW